jgi:predicted amino acid dehydrogenase
VATVDGTDDALVSIAQTGREHLGTAGREAVGTFARALPIRVRAPELHRVWEALTDAMAHADVRPEALARAVGGRRVLELTRVFLTWLEPDAIPWSDASIRPDWAGGTYGYDTASSDTELMVSALVDDGLTLTLRGTTLAAAVAPVLEAALRDDAGPDAAIVGYLPARLPAPDLPPMVVETVDAPHGRTELVLLPIREDRLAGTPDLDARVREAAATTQAPWIALAGMLPALTGLGARPLTGPHQTLTTGHTVTVVATALTTRAVLDALGADWSRCHVGCLGYGAIGRATLALLRDQLGEPGALSIDDPTWPDRSSVVGCDIVLGATSAGGVLDVASLPAGTVVVVDDSFPQAFDVDAARARMTDARDVLLLGGGMLDVGPLIRVSPFAQAEALRAQYPTDWLPGCHAEALLLGARPELGRTAGVVGLTRARAVAEAVVDLGWRAAPLHLGAWTVPEAIVQAVATLWARGAAPGGGAPASRR